MPTHDALETDTPQRAAVRCRACKLYRVLTDENPRPPAMCPSCRTINQWESLPVGHATLEPMSAARQRRVTPLRPWLVSPERAIVRPDDGDARRKPRPVPMSSIKTQKKVRYRTGIAILDRALGDLLTGPGAALGDAAAFAGPPGTGKSTLCLQALAGLTDFVIPDGELVRCLLAIGEETIENVTLRGERIGIPPHQLAKIDVVRCEDYDDFADMVIEGEYDVALCDSMQAMVSKHCNGSMRSLLQISYGAKIMADLAHGTGPYKGSGTRVIHSICHADKDGNMAGPNAAKHEVDALFLLEHFDPIEGCMLEPKRRMGYVRMLAEKNRSGDAQGSTVIDEDGEASELEFYWRNPPGRLEPLDRVAWAAGRLPGAPRVVRVSRGNQGGLGLTGEGDDV